MLELLYENRDKMACKMYLAGFLLIVMIVAPLNSLRKSYENNMQYNKVAEMLKAGPTPSGKQIPLSEIFPLFYQSPYHGQWEKSIRKSKFLEEERGKFQLHATYNSSKDTNNYDLRLLVYDGQFRDNGFFQISLDSSLIIAKQKFDQSSVLYQTIAPLIGVYQKGYNMHQSAKETMYINKIKMKIGFSESIDIQFLISSEYNINIVVRSLEIYYQTLHDILFGFWVSLQSIAEIVGFYSIFEEIYAYRMSAARYSFLGLQSATVWDSVVTVLLFVLCTGSERRFSIFLFPAVLSAVKVLYMEIKALELISSSTEEHSTFKFYLRVYGSIIVGVLIAYFTNLHATVFIAGCVMIVVPQIWTSYRVRHKLKVQFNLYLLFVLPRYSIIIYTRFYDGNIFSLEPDYTLVIICVVLISLQILLVKLQQMYGVRAILPKFMNFSQFKYFMNEPQAEDIECSICLNSLRQMPSLGHLFVEEKQIYNNVVETPCRHKFHVKCLKSWMETKLQCPNCRAIMPPLEEE